MNAEKLPYDPEMVWHLTKLVKRGEGLQQEFKQKASHPEKIVRELVAFANTEGGVLYIGVSDDGTLTGTRYPDEDVHVIRQELMRTCKPPLDVQFNIIRLSAKRFVVEAEVSKSDHRPHEVRNGKDHAVFVRVKDQSIQCSAEHREIIRRSRLGKGVKFIYGEAEQQLMKYLELHGRITLKEYRDVGKLSHFQAARKLVLLTLSGVIRIVPTDKGDHYVAAGSAH
ncbi:MAG: ATP-binding protein [Cyclobacteriaceae bacterium]|nr:ATP-binding protein [Cyclobacteriaceae bacterium]